MLNSLCSERWCIDDYFGSFYSWSHSAHPSISQWTYKLFFTTNLGQLLFDFFEYDITPSVASIKSLIENHHKNNVSYVDITFIPRHGMTIMKWCQSVVFVCQSLMEHSTCLQLFSMWVHERFLPEGILEFCIAIMQEFITPPWYLHYILLHAPQFGDPIDTDRYLFYISPASLPTIFFPSLSHFGYDSCLPYASMAHIVVTNLIIPPQPSQPVLDKVLIVAAVHPSSQTFLVFLVPAIF